MLKLMMSLSFALVSISGAQLCYAANASQFELESAGIPAQTLAASPATIQGQVKFEKRSTRVADEQCGRAPCFRSQVYWSMVVHSGDNRYIFDQQLHPNEARAPESVEVAGVVLRSGSVVKIEGEIIEGGPQFFILTQIKSVALLMDLNQADPTP
jgi:hypothetical protein